MSTIRLRLLKKIILNAIKRGTSHALSPWRVDTPFINSINRLAPPIALSSLRRVKSNLLNHSWIRQCKCRLPRARSYCQHICQARRESRRRLYHSPNMKILRWTLLFEFLSSLPPPPLVTSPIRCIYVYTSHVYFLIRRVFYWNNRSFCLWHMHARHIFLLPPQFKVKLAPRNARLLMDYLRFSTRRYQGGLLLRIRLRKFFIQRPNFKVHSKNSLDQTLKYILKIVFILIRMSILMTST